MKRYLSSKNTFTVVILWSFVILMLALLVIGLQMEHLSLLPISILSFVVALIVWVLLDTRYVIKQHFLLYRSGPFRGRIDIEKIKKIKYFSGMNVPVTMKPALDTKGYIITYNNFDDVYVTPKSSDIFIQELLKINPNIEVQH
ncbi:MAG TPA: PH domain-containing protein [Flavobacterium sp.]|nr:PH domain-containing protein [Flavobacterium sp.]